MKRSTTITTSVCCAKLIPILPMRDRLVVRIVQLENSRIREQPFVPIARLDTNATAEARLVAGRESTAMEKTVAKFVNQAINARAKPTGLNAIVGRTKTKPAPKIVRVAQKVNINQTLLDLFAKHAQLGIIALLYHHSLVEAKFCFAPPVLPHRLLPALDIILFQILKKRYLRGKLRRFALVGTLV